MVASVALDLSLLRTAIQQEYAEVATDPQKGFHFHTGRTLAAMLGYEPDKTDPLKPRQSCGCIFLQCS